MDVMTNPFVVAGAITIFFMALTYPAPSMRYADQRSLTDANAARGNLSTDDDGNLLKRDGRVDICLPMRQVVPESLLPSLRRSTSGSTKRTSRRINPGNDRARQRGVAVPIIFHAVSVFHAAVAGILLGSLPLLYVWWFESRGSRNLSVIAKPG